MTTEQRIHAYKQVLQHVAYLYKATNQYLKQFSRKDNSINTQIDMSNTYAELFLLNLHGDDFLKQKNPTHKHR